MDDRMLTMNEACQFLHICKNTMRRWEDAGMIVPTRTAGGHRRYLKEDLLRLTNNHFPKHKKITVGYCRVSTSGQKADLDRQVAVVTNYCEKNGYRFRIIKDVGSGLNYNKKGLNELIDSVCADEVERIVVNYKDRLTRFGYELIERVCNDHDVALEVINDSDDVSAEDELVQDVLSIITVFSAKLYGNRSRRNKEIVAKSRELFGKSVSTEECDSGEGAIPTE